MADNIQKIISCLEKTLPVYTQAPLAGYSTFKLGGPADVLVQPDTVERVQAIARCVATHAVPYVIIGGGSNILISDEGFRGIVIAPRLKEIVRRGTQVQVGASVGLQQFLQWLKKEGLSGLEYLVGIPGSVGGALAGNAGTSQQWIDSCVQEVDTVNMETAEVHIFPKNECEYSYRFSRFKETQEHLITSGLLELKQKESTEIANTMKEFLAKRKTQPTGSSSAGCVFKNPKEIPAGKLIDEMGLKGKQIGGAKISTEHGNFMLNLGNARATDIIKLISYVKQQVRDKRGIQLQEEIRYIGF